MLSSVTKRFFLTAGLSFGLGHMAFAKAPKTSLRPRARGNGAKRPKQQVAAPSSAKGIVDAAQLGGTVGFAVADLRTGKMFETREANKALPPASTAKTVTALYALQTLGAGYRFTTRLMTTGSVSGGVVTGDLLLVGGGDPTLDTDAMASMAAALKQKGIKGVRGGFYYVDTALPHLKEIDGSQPDHVGYNPAISGLNLNFNRVHFEWRRGSKGYAVTMDARSKKHRPDVRMARMKIASHDLPVYTYKDGGTFDQWTVARSALGKGGARWLPVRKPGLYAAEVFATFARAQGIALKAPQRRNSASGAKSLVAHQSAPLTTILRDMLKYSTNLTAEAVGMTATRKRTGTVRTLKASASEMNAWAKKALSIGNAKFLDHSGLSDGSHVTAQGMVRVMLAAERKVEFQALLKKIPMRDAKRRVIKNHPIKVFAKTGTLNFVSALTGYVVTPDGRRMAFATLCADTGRRSRIRKSDMEAPKGGRAWNRRAKALQQHLIERWSAVYG